ncbi:DUF1753-domain-containing protein [Westerdykella ornata]|uniref:DUF1753-domain-containing protein n=1 Tax=Westerdykella ornata TaxID=318751 RepID=A0A6A6JBC0_WESOR|nr:DUF1753-domain-containing protein [Westerdykella ornata]KAF2273557.1 DUF1753-domain-containing protein [Westerdykella ornata]
MPLSLLEIPRPRTFLHILSLRTGAEIITYLQLINKVSGFFGLLALLTGAHLTALQLSMYLYSALAFLATLLLAKHIKLQTPFPNLLLAHLYAFDSVVNALYTAIFGIAWFSLLAQHPGDSKAPGAATISENAGFTSPQFNVSKVEVIAAPASGLPSGQEAVAAGVGAGAASSAGLGGAVFQSGSIMSISMIVGFWALRVYFVFVMLAFARQCLRQHIATTASAGWYDSNMQTTAGAANLAENPFEEGKEEGAGFKGKLGRIMLKGAPVYWLGADEGEDWMRGLGGKFRKASIGLEAGQGVNERERRRRSGTGPPAPPREIRIPQLADLQEVR